MELALVPKDGKVRIAAKGYAITTSTDRGAKSATATRTTPSIVILGVVSANANQAGRAGNARGRARCSPTAWAVRISATARTALNAHQ